MSQIKCNAFVRFIAKRSMMSCTKKYSPEVSERIGPYFEIRCDFCGMHLYTEGFFGVMLKVLALHNRWLTPIRVNKKLIVNKLDIVHFCSKSCEEELMELYE